MSDKSMKDDVTSESKALREKLVYQPQPVQDVYDAELEQAVVAFNEDYKDYLNKGKTEREVVKNSVKLLEAEGFKAISDCETLSAGDKVYANVLGKGLMAGVIGQDVLDGFNIVGAHVDSPRIDLKPLPVYEAGEMVYFSTHYYGGVKKYQWTSIPLALHGVIYTQDGEKVEISVGEDQDDPVFVFNDLLPHLGREQMQKTGAKVIEAEDLRLLVGGTGHADKEAKERYKLEILRILNEKYGIVERDFMTAELSIVPAFKARDVGFDRAFVASYGQDDRVCAYTALRAVMSVENPQRTTVVMLTDKEEIGSYGNTGAQSQLYENFFIDVIAKAHGSVELDTYRKVLSRSVMLSTDVTNAYDPVFSNVSDPQNNAYCGRGLFLQKYTGGGGKGGASDASSEYMSTVAHLFDREGIHWQTGEMGKVDVGGGGTICHVVAKLGIQAIDAGVPVLSMHAPYELCHKHDIFETYRGYACFLEHMTQQAGNHEDATLRL